MGFLIKFIFILALFCNSNAFANDNLLSKVKGLDNIYVADVYFFETLSEEFGLSSAKIKNLIELKLRQCGIKIKKEIDSNSVCIFTEVHSIKYKPTPVFLKIDICENATIDRTGKFAFAYIWQKSTMFLYHDNKELGQKIYECIESWMDDFCNKYLEANPRIFAENTVKVK